MRRYQPSVDCWSFQFIIYVNNIFKNVVIQIVFKEINLVKKVMKLINIHFSLNYLDIANYFLLWTSHQRKCWPILVHRNENQYCKFANYFDRQIRLGWVNISVTEMQIEFSSLSIANYVYNVRYPFCTLMLNNYHLFVYKMWDDAFRTTKNAIIKIPKPNIPKALICAKIKFAKTQTRMLFQTFYIYRYLCAHILNLFTLEKVFTSMNMIDSVWHSRLVNYFKKALLSHTIKNAKTHKKCWFF